MKITIDVDKQWDKCGDEYLNNTNEELVFEDWNENNIALFINGNKDEVRFISKSDLRKLLRVIF